MFQAKFTSAIKTVIAAQRHVNQLQENAEDKQQQGQFSVFDQQTQDINDLKYLDVFIQLTEQCLNNANKSATLCTDLIMHISNVISDPTQWKKHFNSEIQYQKNAIHEKINQFLSNSMLIVENQKPVQKIMIMALTNLVAVDEPDDETLCEMILKTLKDLYKNNYELRKILQSAITKNVIINLEQDDLMNVSQCLLNGLIDFGRDIDIGSWFTEKQCQIIGRWLDQIFTLFSNRDVDSEKFLLMESALALMSQCFKDENFQTLIEISVKMKGVLSVFTYCFVDRKKSGGTSKDVKGKLKPDEAYQKNKITFFILEMASSIRSLLRKSEPDDKKTYNDKIASEIKYMISELEDKKFNFAFSDLVVNPEHCQILNKKLGSLLKAYGNIIIDDENCIFSQNQIIDKILYLIQQKKIDPYIYGCLCQFIITLISSKCCKLNVDNLQYLFQKCDNFLPLLQMFTKQQYFDLITMAKVYHTTITLPSEFSLSFMPSRELQYAIHQIIMCLKTLQDLVDDSSHPFRDQISLKVKTLDNLNYKSLILLCIEAPVEEIRINASELLSKIPIDKWEFDDVKTMYKVLEKMEALLEDGYGEVEISTLMMIFCQITSQKHSQVTNQFKDSQSAINVANVTHQILKIDMNRNTQGDKEQTKQKLDLAATCVYMLKQYSYSHHLRANLVNGQLLSNISDCLRLEDNLIGDSEFPLEIEGLCLLIQPLFQAIEADHKFVSPYHLNFFKILMQICNILNQKVYILAAQEENNDKNQMQYVDDQVEFSEAAEIFQNNKSAIMQSCFDQWETWKLDTNTELELFKNADDLISAFEVQHTIFSAQNGVDRLLICLQPIIQKATIVVDAEQELTVDQLIQQDDQNDINSKHKRVLTAAFTRHALFSKLIGYDIQPKNELQQYQSQFFEVVQNKKTLANSMFDITKFTEKQFFDFITNQNSVRVKIALITSALFYSCYISIIFAPTVEIKKNALGEIQQKEKLVDFIKLCYMSEWYNGNVSLKLLKIYRLVIQYVIHQFNVENQYEVEKKNINDQKNQTKKLEESEEIIDAKLAQLEKIFTSLKERYDRISKQCYKTELSDMQQLENCKLINRMMKIIISDFKEILECLDSDQLSKQLKLLNSIFKTIGTVFKQMIYIACKSIGEQNLDDNLFIYLRKCSQLISIPIFFEELTICIYKLDKKITYTDDILFQKIFQHLSSVLAFYYIENNQDLTQIFGNLCKSFDSKKLAATVEASIKEWVIWMMLLKLFSTNSSPQTQYYKQIPIFVSFIEYRKENQASFTKNCVLVFYASHLLIFEPIDIKINQTFLQHQLSHQNYKYHLSLSGFQIKDYYIEDTTEEDTALQLSVELKATDQSTQFNDKCKVLVLLFETPYQRKKCEKLFKKYMDDENENIII